VSGSGTNGVDTRIANAALAGIPRLLHSVPGSVSATSTCTGAPSAARDGGMQSTGSESVKIIVRRATDSSRCSSSTLDALAVTR
jgi:hypothetical protein